MLTKAEEFLQSWEPRMARAKAAAPELGKAFASMFANLMKEGALSIREKELIALGIALADRCEPCVALHTRKALHAGASREQVLEAAGVAIVMQGGPAYTYLPYLVEAIEAVQKTEPQQT